MNKRKIDMSPTIEIIGKNVKLLRLIRDMSQGDLAEAAQVQRQYIWNLETREAAKKIEPQLNTLMRVADALGVTISQLFQPIELIVSDAGRRIELR